METFFTIAETVRIMMATDIECGKYGMAKKYAKILRLFCLNETDLETTILRQIDQEVGNLRKKE